MTYKVVVIEPNNHLDAEDAQIENEDNIDAEQNEVVYFHDHKTNHKSVALN